MNYAAYRETNSSLHDSDKNRLSGSEHYLSARPVGNPSLGAEGHLDKNDGDATRLSSGTQSFASALALPQSDESVLGRIVRRAKRQAAANVP